MIKVNRKIVDGNYFLADIFEGLIDEEILNEIFKTKREIEDVFLKTKVMVSRDDIYMFVKNDDGTIVIGSNHLKNSEIKIIYLDIIHELVHVKQHRKGLDLYDDSFSYVERPTELEAYGIAVKEAKRIGMKTDEIMDYLSVEWITPKDHLRLASRLGVQVKNT